MFAGDETLIGAIFRIAESAWCILDVALKSGIEAGAYVGVSRSS
jgi:hypothetical protein